MLDLAMRRNKRVKFKLNLIAYIQVSYRALFFADKNTLLRAERLRAIDHRHVLELVYWVISED